MNDMTRLIPELDKLMQRVEDLKVGETERLEAQRESLMRMFTSVINRDYTPDDVNPSEVFTSEFYEAVHQKEPGYQRNNWFSKKYVDLLSGFNFQNIFELGSGNGQATLALSAIANRVTACDFNDNPYAHLENVTFHKASFFDLPTNISADIAVSADVLEHFPTGKLVDVIGGLQKIAPKGLHLIAGYPDGMSHLSVLPPWHWLSIFRLFDPSYQLVDIEFRKEKVDKPVFVITNLI